MSACCNFSMLRHGCFDLFKSMQNPTENLFTGMRFRATIRSAILRGHGFACEEGGAK